MPDSDIPALASEVRVAVMRLRRRLINQRSPEADLSIGMREVLGVLYRQGPLTVGELADFEQVRPPSMTRTINHLAERGLVTRTRCTDDKRQTRITLTEAGGQIIKDGRDLRDAWLAQRLAELTEAERETLRQAAALLAALATDPDAAR